MLLFDIHKEGWVEVICGPMFAGKTEELIRRINRLKYAKKQYRLFKPKIDTRFSETEVVSHNGLNHEAIVIEHARDILHYVNQGIEAVGIDEVQFFDTDIIEVCEYLASHGVRVIVGGLDMDFRGESFAVMRELVVRAEFVTKLTAICMTCGAPATRTQRLVDASPVRYNDPIILVGANESYEARCRHCHTVRDKPTFFDQK